MTECSVEDGSQHSRTLYPLRRGMCQRHYLQYKKSIEWRSRYPLRGKSPTKKDILSHVGWNVVQRDTPFADGPCWEWRGNRECGGYGRFSMNGKKVKTHRAAYETWVGPIPEGMVVRHMCDNPPCINPEHLKLGTPKDNARDREEHGRDKNGNQRFSDEDILEIARLGLEGVSTKEIADRFSCSLSHVQRVISGSVRKDLPRRTKSRTRLGWDNVRYIRSPEGMSEQNVVLAHRFGVDPSVISAVKHNRKWIE